MSRKGTIDPKSDIEIRFAADAGNRAPAEFWAGFGGLYTPGNVPGTNVRPGADAGATLRSNGDHYLWIHVNLYPNGDSGSLEVQVNGMLRDAGQVSGDTWWYYTVKQPLGAIAGLPGLDLSDSRQTPREG